MLSDLLISSQATTGIIIAAACVFAVALVLYGVFRKFNQMGWMPWQIVIIFFIMMGVEKIPMTVKDDMRLWILGAVFLVTTGVILGAGALIRYRMLVRVRPAPLFFRICNRVLGGITAVLGLGVAVAAIAGFALPVCAYAIPPARDILSSIIFETAIWKAISGYALDFFLIAVLVCTVSAGYRVGFGRGLLTILMCVFALGSLVLAVFLAVGVPGLRGMGDGLAGAIGGNRVVAIAVGYGISILIWFILIFTVLALLGFLLHKLFRRLRYIRPLGIFGGCIMAIIFLALMLVLALGVDALVSWMAEGGLRSALSQAGVEGMENLISTIEEYARGIADAFTSSPFSRALYLGNPIRGFLPS